MKVLVTGAGGFVGKHLLKALLDRNHIVAALGIGCQALKGMPVALYEANILDFVAILEAMKAFKSDAVIHLAAQSNVPKSWNMPDETAKINIIGTINVFKAFCNVNINGKFINIGSGDEYGLTASKCSLLTEDVKCEPQNPYAISKLCAEQMVLQLGNLYGLNVISTRSFNHFGPYQQKGFVVSDFASQIAAIVLGKQKPEIKVGNIEVARDFLYVGDIVNAYTELLENNVESGVYNVASGKSMVIKDILKTLIKLSNKDIEILVDDSKVRKYDVKSFAGDNSKILKATNWKYDSNIEKHLKYTLDYWIDELVERK